MGGQNVSWMSVEGQKRDRQQEERGGGRERRGVESRELEGIYIYICIWAE